MGRKKTTEEFIKEVNELVGADYEVIGTYEGMHTKIDMKHIVCGFIYKTTPNNFLIGRRCPKCGLEKKKDRIVKTRKSNEAFIEEVKKLVGADYEILKEYKTNATKIRVVHKKCGHQYEVLPTNFLRGSRCPVCALQRKKIGE